MLNINAICITCLSLFIYQSVHFLRILQWWGKTTKGPIRAVASDYSWGGGGVGQKFPNNEKKFLIYHGIRSHEGACYPENGDAILNKHKYAYFTHRHYSSMQCHRKLYLIGAENEGRSPEENFKFRVSEMPFPGLWGKFWQNSDG
jgi:hypothetical protein